MSHATDADLVNFLKIEAAPEDVYMRRHSTGFVVLKRAPLDLKQGEDAARWRPQKWLSTRPVTPPRLAIQWSEKLLRKHDFAPRSLLDYSRSISATLGANRCHHQSGATLDRRIQCQETVPRSGWAITIASNVTLVLWHRPASLGARASVTA